MKAATLLVGFFAIYRLALAENNDVAQHLIEEIIKNVVHRFFEKLAPSDPIIIDQGEINLLGLLRGNVSNFSMQGFTNVAVTSVSLTGQKTWTLDMTITAPLFKTNVEYWKIKSSLFYGEGAASINVENVTVKVRGEYNPDTNKIVSLHIVPHIGNVKVALSGLYNDPKLSKTYSKMSEHILKKVVNSSEFQDILRKLVLPLLKNL